MIKNELSSIKYYFPFPFFFEKKNPFNSGIYVFIDSLSKRLVFFVLRHFEKKKKKKKNNN